MARYQAVGEAPAAAAAGVVFANLNSAAASVFKLRRIVLGGRMNSAVAPTAQQLTIGLARTTSAGTTPTATNAAQKMDPNSPASALLGVTVGTFATPPTFAAVQFETTIATSSTQDIPFEGIEEMVSTVGTANGWGLVVVSIAAPTNFIITSSWEWEE